MARAAAKVANNQEGGPAVAIDSARDRLQECLLDGGRPQRVENCRLADDEMILR